jgi:hypothetical protein
MEVEQQINPKSTFQLEDLIAYYPPSDTKKIQTIISAKKEFNELAATVSEKVPKKGQFYNHQKLVQRLMRAVDRLLVLHEAGTGKTCTMLAVGEFYEMMARIMEGVQDSLLRQGVPIRKAYVLVRNDILMDEFIDQLVCVCTYNKYETKAMKEATSEKRRLFLLKKEIKKFYKIMNFREFSNKINEIRDEGIDEETGKTIYNIRPIMSEEKIKKKFSNCLFFADEIHNLRNVSGDFGDMTESELETGEVNYASLWKVLHTAQNIKVILATATPMINEPADLVPTLNLLLPVENQVEDGTNFAKMKLKEFEPIVRGLVSFVRVLDTGIDVIYEGQPLIGGALNVGGHLVEPTSIVNISTMSDFQAKTYIEAEYKESKGTKKTRTGGIRKAARHASNFVFPKEIYIEKGIPTFDESQVGRYGSDGFTKYVIFENDKYKFEKNFSKLLDEEENLQIFSEKFLNVISLCENDPGSCFCYTDDFAKASGSILLGLCFEKYGYKRFDTNAVSFKIVASKNQSQKSSVFCKKDSEDIQKQIIIKPEKRYAILTSDSDKETIRNILNVFNSNENVNGEYIKVIIASRKAREGLNLANVQNIHLVNPSWNQANMYQAMFRALRATSHIEILKILKQQAIDEGKTESQVNKIRVKVRVYQHCSVVPDDEEIQKLSLDLLGKEDVSVELQMYQLSEQKDRNNALVMRMLKQCALDCQINKERNARRTSDIDGTAVCNYMSCDYDCVDPPPETIDFTTYDVYYKDELVEKIKDQLIELFNIKNNYNAYEIFELIPDYPPKFVLQSLAELIKNKTTFVNRYGFTSFLNEDGDKFFLVNELNSYSTDNNILSKKSLISQTEYNETLYSVGKKTFDETIRQIRYPADQEKAEKLLDSEDLLEKVKGLDTNVLINLIESILQKKFNKEQISTGEKKVLKRFGNLIFNFNEPLSLLEEKKEERSEPTIAKRGRKRDLTKAAKVKKIKDIDLDEIEFGDPVMVHILDLLRVDKSGYTTTTKFEKGDANIRLFKPTENKWRDVTEVEKLAYNALIQGNRITQFGELFGDQEVFGTILQDDTFRIIDRAKKSEKLKGQECTSPTYQKLTDLLYRLKLNPEDFEIELVNQVPKDEEAIRKYLEKEKKYTKTDKMTKPELLFAAKWVATGLKKNGICQYIQQYFDANKLLYRLIQ